jgi:hypothetical protein
MISTSNENQIDFEPKNKVLYFPYINVPNNEWFTQILLYWDEVGAIVPRDYIQEPGKLDRHMVELVRTELVKQIIPDMYSMEAGRNFAPAFIHLIEKVGINQKVRNSRFGPHYSTRIHIDKFGYEISEYLVDEKLAIRDNYPWYIVESTTAGLFMSYLASFLGNSKEINMQPITDDVTSLVTFSEDYAVGDFNQNYYLDRMRISVLEEILPVPRNIEDVTSIVQFKEKYGDLLPKFRKKIESKIQELSFIINREEREFHLTKFSQSTREETEELVARMNEKNWGRIVFGTFCGLGAAAIPGAKAIIEKDIIAGLEAIPGLMGAVYAAYEGFDSRQKSIIRSPYAYAAYVKRELY